MDSLLQAPLFVFLRKAALERLPTLTAMFAGVIVFFWMVRPLAAPVVSTSTTHDLKSLPCCLFGVHAETCV